MAISTYRTYLMMKNASDQWEKLVDIKDFPDLGSAPETLDTTTTGDKSRTYIPGIQEEDAMGFTCNYTEDEFNMLYALRGSLKSYAVWFGNNGFNDKYSFDGYLDVYINGGGVNEVTDMTITIAPSSAIRPNDGGSDAESAVLGVGVLGQMVLGAS